MTIVLPDEAGRLKNRLLLTPEEVAERLALGRSTIYELMRAGRIPSVKIGGSRRVTVRALEAFVADLEAT